MNYLKLMAYIIAISASTRGFANGLWHSYSHPNDLANPLADLLVHKISKGLHEEGSKTIFYSLQCSTTGSLNNDFCTVFEAALKSAFIVNGIELLPEDEAQAIREKVAEELVYQQGTGMVDSQLATKLGKQVAINAIVNIKVLRDRKRYQAFGDSLNMEKGTLTVSENVELFSKKEMRRTWQDTALSAAGLIVGLGGGIYAGVEAYHLQSEAEKKYEEYDMAANHEEAAIRRREAQKLDDKVDIHKGVAIGFAALSAASVYYYYFIAGKFHNLYSIEDQGIKSTNHDDDSQQFHFSLLDYEGKAHLGLGVNFQF